MPTRRYEAAPQPRLFGRQLPPHAVLGGGQVADILLWRDKKSSAAILSAFIVVWFLFEVVEYSFVTLISQILIATMLFLYVWHIAAGLITWNVPKFSSIEIPPHIFILFSKKINWFLRKFYEISLGKDLKLFFLTITGLWIMSAIASNFTTSSLLYVVFLGALTLPVMYERYEYEVDYLASKGNQDLKRLLMYLDSKFLSKIPRGPVKEKKYR